MISSAPPVEDGSTDESPPIEELPPCLHEKLNNRAMKMKKILDFIGIVLGIVMIRCKKLK